MSSSVMVYSTTIVYHIEHYDVEIVRISLRSLVTSYQLQAV